MKIHMRNFQLFTIIILFASGCSALKTWSKSPTEFQEIAADSPTQAATEEKPLLNPTCIPQPVGSCARPGPDEPVEIIGDIPYTSPFFLNTISEPFVMLEDEAGFVKRDKEFRFSLRSQVIGPVELSDDDKLTYSLSLPTVPQATYVDVDNNGKNDLGLQVFAVAYWSNTWGDPFLEERDGKGWSTAYTSAITDPENDNEIVGGTLIIWAPDDQQGFPSGYGPDGLLFTADDPIALVQAGYTLVDLESDPFRFYKESQPVLTLNEGAGAVKDLSDQSYIEAFEELYKKVSIEYPFTQEKKIDWDKLYREYQPKFDQVQTDQDFYIVMRDFIFNIPDGHVNLSLDPKIFYSLYGGGFGLVLDKLSDQRVVAKHVLQDYPAAQAGILEGAEMLAWENEPINVAINKVVPGFGPFSTAHTLEQAQVNFLTRVHPDARIQIEFRNPGSTQNQNISMQSVSEYDSLFLTIPSFNADKLEMPITGNILDENGLGYIRINTFSDDYSLIAKLWDRYIQNLVDNEVPGLIIDIRNNPGGSLGLAMDFTGYFFDQEITLYENFYYSDVKNQFEPTGYPTQIKPAPRFYDGPIIVLVSSECVSACEGFAYALHYNERSTIVGHFPTAGAFGEVGLGQYQLPGDYSIQFPTGRPEAEDGTVIIEGQGILPDILVPITEESALGKVDAVLEAAIRDLIVKIR